MELKNWKLLGAGITIAVLTSCGDGKEKVRQDAKEKAQTEEQMVSEFGLSKAGKNTDKKTSSDGKWSVSSKKDEYSAIIDNNGEKVNIKTEYSLYSQKAREKKIYSSGDVEAKFDLIDTDMVVTKDGKNSSDEIVNMNGSEVKRDAKLPQRPKAPKRKVNDALTQTLADRRKNKR